MDEDDFFSDEVEEDSTEGAVGWLDCPKPPVMVGLPSDPKEKVLAVTDILEEKGLGLDVVAAEHPKWFYNHFLKPLLPKESKIEMKQEILNEYQLDARIHHLVAQLGPEVVGRYVAGTSLEGTCRAIGGEEPQEAEVEDIDLLS